MGCFDEESTPRYLLLHEPSNYLYEDYNPATVAQALDTGDVQDVTDIAVHEEQHAKNLLKVPKRKIKGK